jgi:hypothetical protein
MSSMRLIAGFKNGKTAATEPRRKGIPPGPAAAGSRNKAGLKSGAEIKPLLISTATVLYRNGEAGCEAPPLAATIS